MIEYVWVFSERAWGVLIHYGVEYSLVRYDADGLEIEEWLENDDFEIWGEHAYEYERDE